MLDEPMSYEAWWSQNAAELRSSKLPCIASKTFLRLEHTSISKEIQPKTLIKHSSKKFMSAGLHRQRAHRQLSLGVQCNALPGSLEILATNTLARDVTVTIVSAISATTLVKAFALLKKAGVHQVILQTSLYVIRQKDLQGLNQLLKFCHYPLG